jgi:hypothetical protein
MGSEIAAPGVTFHSCWNEKNRDEMKIKVNENRENLPRRTNGSTLIAFPDAPPRRAIIPFSNLTQRLHLTHQLTN